MFFNHSNGKCQISILTVVGKRLYHKTPAYLQCFFWPVKSIYKLLDTLRLNLWILLGDEISSKQRLVIVYAGHGENKNFIAKLAFDYSHRENYIGKKWLWEIPEFVKVGNHDCSLMVIEVPYSFCRFFKKIKYLIVPCWVSGELDVSVESPSIFKNKNTSLNSDLRRIRKNNLHFKVTRNLSEFHNFYYKMYLPYITQAHGDKSLIAIYDILKKNFKKNRPVIELLFVTKEQEDIAGILLSHWEDRAKLCFLGVKDGNSDYVKHGAIGALLYFSFCYLSEKGCTRISFGNSRPFLKDGVLRYKRKWNQEISNKRKMNFIFKPLSKTEGVKGFFLNNPLIYEDQTGLNAAIFATGDQTFSEKDYTKLYKNYYFKGLSKLMIYQFEETGRRTDASVPPEFSDRIKICSVDSIFEPDVEAVL